MHVIINDRAGTVVGADGEAIADSVTRALEAGGHAVETSLIKPEQLDAALERARSEFPDVLIVGGGDGTLRYAASVLLDSPVALGVLPLGTVNRFARDLGIPLEPKAAAEALAQGTIRQVDVAEVNGRLYLCNAILGLTTRFSTVRQSLRGKAVMERLTGYTGALREMLNARRRLGVRIDDGKVETNVRVLSLIVTNNAYADDSTLTMRRPRLDAGTLAVYASRHKSGWRMAAAAIKAMVGRIGGDQGIVHLTSKGLTVNVPSRRSVPLSIDGEVEHVSTPLVFAIRPKALKVLGPRDPASA
ncbi:MAG: diacylglycerol kinase family protein [Hyphomicrobiaceae bacterium]